MLLAAAFVRCGERPADPFVPWARCARRIAVVVPSLQDRRHQHQQHCSRALLLVRVTCTIKCSMCGPGAEPGHHFGIDICTRAVPLCALACTHSPIQGKIEANELRDKLQASAQDVAKQTAHAHAVMSWADTEQGNANQHHAAIRTRVAGRCLGKRFL